MLQRKRERTELSFKACRVVLELTTSFNKFKVFKVMSYFFIFSGIEYPVIFLNLPPNYGEL